jgi:hypothetical protein
MAADDRVTSGPADSGLVLDAVHVAVAWAKDPVGQLLQAKLDAARQFPGSPQLEICGRKFLRSPAVGRSSICLPVALLLRSPFALDPSALYVATVPDIHTHDFPGSDKQRHLNAQAIVKGCIFPGAILL